MVFFQILRHMQQNRNKKVTFKHLEVYKFKTHLITFTYNILKIDFPRPCIVRHVEMFSVAFKMDQTTTIKP